MFPFWKTRNDRKQFDKNGPTQKCSSSNKMLTETGISYVQLPSVRKICLSSCYVKMESYWNERLLLIPRGNFLEWISNYLSSADLSLHLHIIIIYGISIRMEYASEWEFSFCAFFLRFHMRSLFLLFHVKLIN